MNLKPLLLFALALIPSLSQRTNQQPVNYVPETSRLLPVASNKPLAHGPEKARDVEKLKQSDWYSAAMKNMQEGEYHFKKVGNSYSTPNRKNNLRFYYDEKGFTVQPRTTQVPVGDYDVTTKSDQIDYITLPDWKVAFNLDRKQVGKGTWQINGSKAEYQTDNITVQYINNMEGMRQNFIVQRPLSDDEDLKLNFSVETTLEQRISNDRLQFVHEQSGVVLNYEQLKVWDANGKILAASFEKDNDNYAIRVNTFDAAYPITIDPISTTAAAMVESNQANASMGHAVSSAGDVNGDGYSDVIVGAYNYDYGQPNEGAAFIYHGSITGINTTAAAILAINQDGARMGISVASAGDVNGDGYSDVIVGASHYDNGETNEGGAFVYHGSVTGISTTAAAMMEVNQVGARFGESVACAGDVNGDGYSDVIVGDPEYNGGLAREGSFFVYHGSPAGIDITIAARKESNRATSFMGCSVASAGDVNGDGFSDVIVGAHFYNNGESGEGAAFVFYGSATGINTTVSARLESNQAGARMGYSVAGAGDVNGDGYSDVIVGVWFYDNGETDEGAAFVYHGSATGISTTVAAILESNQAGLSMGNSVAGAGDLNGDGFSDVVVGALFYDNYKGAAFVYHGSSTGIDTTASAILEINQADASMGTSVASAGDVNGDGYSDVIVGAPGYDNGETDEGVAFVYHGAATGINTTNTAQVESNQTNAFMGWSVAGAGDVNGDGYSDVIVGARAYDNGEIDEGAVFIYHGSLTGINSTAAAMLEGNLSGAQFGSSVSGAGDVNGDGYSDIIVGASFYSNGETNEGAAFVFLGSATGVGTVVATILESNQANALMGFFVSSAGDVNGDGYSDIIVGAQGYDRDQTDEGAAFIYYGSPTGIDATALSIVESNQSGSNFGCSVAGAGDVNGDGYGDVIVGARTYDNGAADEGAAFVYHGSATGISTTSAAMVASGQPQTNMGYSVAGAGDVNGDGYSDVIVGAPDYNTVSANEGAALIYYGSASGISSAATILAGGKDTFSDYGVAVAGAGDVNGDGYGDLIVGDPVYGNGESSEGAAFIYHGSAIGPNANPDVTVESNRRAARLGGSVACAGDLNGDGYSDVIIGGSLYTNGESREGAAFVYHGNAATTSNRNNLNLYNVDLTTPISSSNFPHTNFGTGLYAKSFLGRGKGKLVWETKVSYEPFSGSPITNSVMYTSRQNGYTDLTLTGTELKNLVSKQAGKYTKIRARVQYDPVTAITGQMYGPWRYVPAQTSGSLGGALPVDLISFNVAWHEQGKTARVRFVTEHESEICCYEIEKSDNGFHFNVIGHLDARNAQEQHTYNFIDLQADGKKQYYRLKTIHADGEVDRSRIVLLQDKTTTEILVFPNPTADVLQLQLNKVYSNIRVQIVSSSGRVVKQLVASSDANQTIKVPVGGLTTGSYFLYLQTGEEKQALQFIKQ